MRITENFLIKDILKRTDKGEKIFFYKKGDFKVMELTEKKYKEMMSFKNVIKIKYKDLEINTLLYKSLDLEYMQAALNLNSRKTILKFND